MKVIDLFCGAGGATKGLQRAGFHVTGIDINYQPHYCGNAFIQANVLQLPLQISDFDLIWASPPCQRYSVASQATRSANKHPDLIAPVRQLLIDSGKPYIIENVPRAPLINPTILCGSMFGLGTTTHYLRRHRLFECSFKVKSVPLCAHGQCAISVFGSGGGSSRRDQKRLCCVADRKIAMGIDWMNNKELSQSIPPAYSEFLAQQFLGDI